MTTCFFIVCWSLSLSLCLSGRVNCQDLASIFRHTFGFPFFFFYSFCLIHKFADNLKLKVHAADSWVLLDYFLTVIQCGMNLKMLEEKSNMNRDCFILNIRFKVPGTKLHFLWFFLFLPVFFPCLEGKKKSFFIRNAFLLSQSNVKRQL